MKNAIWYALAILAVTATVILLSLPPHTIKVEVVPQQEVAPVATSTPKAAPKGELYASLKPICGCESVGDPKATPRQFNADGSVIRGVQNPSDVGMCQVNEHYHGAAAEKMGLDLETEYGNITFSNYLYDTQGTAPWNWSKHCWKADVDALVQSALGRNVPQG